MRVRFAEEPDIHVVYRVKRYEHVLLWWQIDDYECFMKQNEQTLSLAEAGINLDSSTIHSMRGLESLLLEGKEARDDRRYAAFIAVVKAQSQQRRLKGPSVDPLFVASAYQRASRDSEKIAREVGLEDEACARRQENPNFLRLQHKVEKKSSRQKKLMRKEAAAKLRSSVSHLLARRFMPVAA